jgi:hypothetical protein
MTDRGLAHEHFVKVLIKEYQREVQGYVMFVLLFLIRGWQNYVETSFDCVVYALLEF